MNILDQIIADKKHEVEESLSTMTNSQVHRQDSDTRVPLDFRRALRKDTLSIIAEVKKASPSKGLIRPDFDPVAIARSYAEHGADCISILTEEKYFQGDSDFLRDIRKVVDIPLLRKDFMIDIRQIRESYDMGADAILLIVSALSAETLALFYKTAQEFGLTCLVEVHTESELDIALSCECNLIGINNRNLSTFETDINHSVRIKQRIPEEIITISESGIHHPEDTTFLRSHGFDAVLVGESLMRQENPGQAIHALMGR